MNLYEITTEYPTVGDGAFEWGEPESLLEVLLDEAGIEILAFGAGTDLATGVRDVDFSVQAESMDVVLDVVEKLPIAKCVLWTVSGAS